MHTNQYVLFQFNSFWQTPVEVRLRVNYILQFIFFVSMNKYRGKKDRNILRLQKIADF